MRTLILLLLATALTACGDDTSSIEATEEVKAAAAKEKTLGFVFTSWGYEIPHDDPGECPEGLNITDEDYFSEEYDEVRAEVERRYNEGDREGALSLLPEDACKNPEIMPDPGHKLFAGAANINGLDLDGKTSAASTGGQCAHDDFADGIDNQHWRLMGCVAGFRPDGLFDRLFDSNSSILENGYSTLLELKIIEGDTSNGKVEARLFTSGGPVTKDVNGDVVRDMSQLVHEDPMYHTDVFSGEIEDGVLTAGPVDAKLKFKVQAIDNHYWFRDLYVRAELQADGAMKGILAGYWDIENVFDFLTEVYIGPIHLGRAAANNIGYQCAGVYHALPRVADGHPDPKTGKCTSMSTVIDFSAVPAFVIKPEATQAAR